MRDERERHGRERGEAKEHRERGEQRQREGRREKEAEPAARGGPIVVDRLGIAGAAVLAALGDERDEAIGQRGELVFDRRIGGRGLLDTELAVGEGEALFTVGFVTREVAVFGQVAHARAHAAERAGDEPAEEGRRRDRTARPRRGGAC